MKYDRQEKIKQLLIERKRLTCAELCDIFHVSIETIRRDLNVLEEDGVIRRVYGGAILADNTAVETPMKPWSTRYILNNTEKADIAEVILSLIEDNMTIALDSGTTVLEIARLLARRKNLNIITNDLYIASELSGNTDHTIYFVGGTLKKDDRITVGFLAKEFLDNFSCIDLAVMTCDGFLDGIGDFNVDMGALKKEMIEKAKKVAVAVDHTKFNIPTLYKVCGLDKLDYVITGKEAPADAVAAIRKAGVEVIPVPRG
ncbi:MAG: DeoR/GlpR transcriptional regulator [Anaerolineaceae bacterium]|nr:DeoR/GlpR transcriptional regulator [Anaerolineaceae bacterium]